MIKPMLVNRRFNFASDWLAAMLSADQMSGVFLLINKKFDKKLFKSIF